MSKKYGGMKRASDWRGKRIVTIEEMRNGYAIVPVGTTGVVDSGHDPFGGLDITFDPCKCCGVQVLMRKVGYHKVKVEKQKLTHRQVYDKIVEGYKLGVLSVKPNTDPDQLSRQANIYAIQNTHKIFLNMTREGEDVDMAR